MYLVIEKRLKAYAVTDAAKRHARQLRNTAYVDLTKYISGKNNTKYIE